MERAAKHREVREKRNQEWRDQTTAAAQKWVAANIPDEGKALLVMGSVQKYHDTIAAARRDVEDGVIGPAVFRDEMNMAKEDFKVELTNHVGAEDYERFMSETRQSPFVGF